MRTDLKRIKEAYNNGENIISYLKKIDKRENNSLDDIIISYDFQAGTYTKRFEKQLDDSRIQDIYKEMAYYVGQYIDEGDVILEPGTGEASSSINTYKYLEDDTKRKISKIYGLDASFSRLKYADKCLKKYGVKNTSLVMGDMLNMPIADNSCDVVVTVHACEPNGGKEHDVLSELMRVTKKYLILFEPAYDFATEEMKRRMEHHGYVINLYDEIKNMGLDVIEHRLLKESLNPMNPTGVTVIKKDNCNQCKADNILADPISKIQCIRKGNVMWSEETMLIYPIIDDIACMMEDNAILATKYGEF